MKVCLDVQYAADTAFAAAVVFDAWQDTDPVNQYTVRVGGIRAYEPGKFYLRELKPLMAAVQRIREPIDIYIIDAHCHLMSETDPGLGAYLHNAIGGRSSIIGVAKNRFRDSRQAVEVLRGKSKRPLYVTSIGIGRRDAAAALRAMAGSHRLPTMITLADRLAREATNAEMNLPHEASR